VATHALDRHLALIGFMGAGKSTLGAEVAERLGRPFVDLDREIEAQHRRTVSELFTHGGEAHFRVLEASAAVEALSKRAPAVIALGGGAAETATLRKALRKHALTVRIDVDFDTAWERVQGGDRPLAQDRDQFHALFDRRKELYETAADATAQDAEEVVLAAGGAVIETGALERLGTLVPGEGPVALVSDPRVHGIYGADVQMALGTRLKSTHELPAGEEAKTVAEAERLWRELRIDRRGTIAAVGGGSTTDAGGFVAATYLRGLDWVAVPTTLVGQVDAALGGKTAVNLPEGKNLVGAFHWPARTVVDPAALATLPEAERRAGLAEVVKTGLLAGERYWELPDLELVRRCAAYKLSICLRDPREAGPREELNLGHTFAHALEAAAGFELPHGRAVALGLLAALRLSGLDTSAVEETLKPEPVRVDRELAWAALARDKKVVDGVPRLVLLEAPGRPKLGVELPAAEVRAALDSLIAG
jgi:shikimate kinase/3-dehydroquinate synthase